MGLHGICGIGQHNLLHWADLDCAGVVHDRIDAPEMFAHRIDHAHNLIRTAHITGDADGIAAGVVEFCDRELELVRVAGTKCQPGSMASKFTGEHQAESARSAGDEHNFVSKFDPPGGPDQRAQAQAHPRAGKGGEHVLVSAVRHGWLPVLVASLLFLLQGTRDRLNARDVPSICKPQPDSFA